jgi:hypothetical protein
MISQSDLQESLIPLCLDVIAKIADGEKDLIRVVVDVVTELRVGDGDEEVEGVGTGCRSSAHYLSRQGWDSYGS